MYSKIVGLDPGTEHFAVVLLTGCETKDITELTCSYRETISFDYFEANSDSVLLFADDMHKLYDKLNITKEDLIYIERYQYRGKMTGPKIEVVNQMIATVVLTAPCKVTQITPVLWKNYFNRYPEDRLPLVAKEGESKVTDHEMDALHIALYAWRQSHNIIQKKGKRK